jgi:hypothetical protein
MRYFPIKLGAALNSQATQDRLFKKHIKEFIRRYK